MSKTTIFALVLIVFCAVGRDTLGSERKKTDNQQIEVVSPIHKGAMELALLTGFGAAHDIWDGDPDVVFLVLGGRFGRVLSNPRGPSFLKGNLEISVEVLPLFLVDQGATTYGGSLTLLGRHFLLPDSRWRPFIGLGFGALRTVHRLPDQSVKFNFTSQLGIGLAYAKHKRFVFYMEYRLHHISSGRAADNPGINSSYLQFGASIFPLVRINGPRRLLNRQRLIKRLCPLAIECNGDIDGDLTRWFMLRRGRNARMLAVSSPGSSR